MEIKGWRFYNHAAVPDCLPHEPVDITPIKDKRIWKLSDSAGKTPLLAQWTEDFDCDHETTWWYVIKDAPFVLEELPSKERKSIRQALRKCRVEKIRWEDHLEGLYACYKAAFSRYETAGKPRTVEEFYAQCMGSSEEWWAGFDAETNMLLGYITTDVYDHCVAIVSLKFDPAFAKRQVCDALYCTVLDHYLNQCQKRYVSSGARNVNHISNTQEYKIRRFGYRKAYCRLCIAYRPGVRLIISVLYIFRKLLRKFDKIRGIHLINAVLLMEEIRRG